MSEKEYVASIISEFKRQIHKSGNCVPEECPVCLKSERVMTLVKEVGE